MTAMPTAPPTFARAAWLFLRLLGVVYFVAFCSFAVQALGLLGHDGILPARLYMGGARAFVASEHLGLDRFRLLPTFFWVSMCNSIEELMILKSHG